MEKELTEAIQEVIDSLGNDGIIFLPEGVYSVVGLRIPSGIWIYGL